MPDVPFVLLIQRVHDNGSPPAVFPAEFLPVSMNMRSPATLPSDCPEPVFHLNGKLRRLSLYNIKGIETAVGSDDGEVCFPSKPLYRRLDAYHISAPRLVRYDVEGSPNPYFTSGRKRICMVFWKVTPIRGAAIIWLVGKSLFPTVLCLYPIRRKHY